MNTGEMPNTDFTYEEFEGFLGSYFLTLLPLRDGGDTRDRQDFQTILDILNGFAERHEVQRPEDTVLCPRKTAEEWGQPKVFSSSFMLVDMLSSFWRDFGIGADPQELDGQERYKLGRLILGILDRHEYIKAKFDTTDGGRVIVGIESWVAEKPTKPLACPH